MGYLLSITSQITTGPLQPEQAVNSVSGEAGWKLGLPQVRYAATGDLCKTFQDLLLGAAMCGKFQGRATVILGQVFCVQSGQNVSCQEGTQSYLGFLGTGRLNSHVNIGLEPLAPSYPVSVLGGPWNERGFLFVCFFNVSGRKRSGSEGPFGY